MSQFNDCHVLNLSASTLIQKREQIFGYLKNLIHPSCPNNVSITNHKILDLIDNSVLLNKYLENKIKLKKNIFFITIFLNIILIICMIKLLN